MHIWASDLRSAAGISRKAAIQPSASKVHLLLECAYPFSYTKSSEPPEEVGEAAIYGTRFHAAIAAALLGQPIETGDEGLDKHVDVACAKLTKWLVENEYTAAHAKSFLVESALGYNDSSNSTYNTPAWLSDPCDPDHFYPNLQPGDVIGTGDLIVVPRDTSRPILVLDHKTGSWGDFTRPEKLSQLMLLGIAACELYKREFFLPVILHAPRGGIPVVHVGEEVSQYGTEAIRFLGKLSRALPLIDSGYLRPGKHCKRCPKKPQCPAHTSDLLRDAGKLVEKASLVGSELVLIGREESSALSREESIGRLHMLMSRFRELDKQASARMKEELLQDPTLEATRPDGKTLRLVHKSVETLSKASIIRALGAEEGGKLIDELRAKGCIEASERTELQAR